jgi:hypothetical protein
MCWCPGALKTGWGAVENQPLLRQFGLDLFAFYSEGVNRMANHLRVAKLLSIQTTDKKKTLAMTACLSYHSADKRRAQR